MPQFVRVRSQSLEEVWKDVVGYEGLYEVSNKGQVRSKDRIVTSVIGVKRFVKSRMMSMMPDNSGHLVVGLNRNNKQQLLLVHRLVLEAFVGPCPPGMEGRHYPKRDPTNNRIDNLSWSTREQNQQDRVKHGTHCRGERCATTHLKERDVREIRSFYSTGKYTLKQLGEKYRLKTGSVHNIVKRKTWKHI